MRLKIIHMHKITRNCLLHCDYIGLNLIEFCKMWMYVVHNCVLFCNSIMQRRSFSVFHRLYLCHCKCILKSKLNVFFSDSILPIPIYVPKVMHSLWLNGKQYLLLHFVMFNHSEW